MENNKTVTADVCVIGAGAAGMMAAVWARRASGGTLDTVVVEKNKYTGRKIGITGKGRCNLTNNCTAREFLDNVRTNPKFLYGSLNRFSPADTMEFFTEAGVELKTERGRRVFPQSDKAADIQRAFERELKKSGVRLMLSSPVTEIKRDGTDTRWFVVTENGVTVSCGRAVVATGGKSYPLTGSDGGGYELLSALGVRIVPPKPSLVPIETKEDFSLLSGLSLKNVELEVTEKSGKKVFLERGEMLFTHFGVSGPLVISASADMQKHPVSDYVMRIDLKPALGREELDRRLISDLAKYSAKDFINSLGDLLPAKLIPYVAAETKIAPHKKSGEVTREERGRLLDALKSFTVTPVSFRPIEEAIITSGGVDVSEIDPKTMELKRYPGLYVAGELIDVDAYTGGYNLQIAFSTGHDAGCGVAEG